MAIPSPCTNICTMDAGTGLCIGCGRTLDEIARWVGMGDPERRTVMRRLADQARAERSRSSSRFLRSRP